MAKKIKHNKFFRAVVDGNFVEVYNLYRYGGVAAALLAFAIVLIVTSILFFGVMIKNRDAKKALDNSQVLYNEMLYNNERSESLNAIMTGLDKYGSPITFPEEPAIDLTTNKQ